MRGGLLAIGALAAAMLVAAGGGALAADVTVLGCNERNPGEVGIRELVADVGDTVAVAVTVHTTAKIDAFALDVSFPNGLLSYVRTDPGDLTAGFSPPIFGRFVDAQGTVRLGGWDPTGIPAGSIGSLAVIHFEVLAAGVDSFSTGAYVDDLEGYVACESAHSPTKILQEAWGRVKALYGE